ncbi:hypothetical protein D3C79_706290 [compost metagenome]
MQIISLVADQLLVIELERKQVAAAVGQPTDPMPIGAGGGDALVEDVVLMPEHGNLWLDQVLQPLMLARVVAGSIVEPLQPADTVVGRQQVAIAVIGKGFNLPLVTATPSGLALDEPAHGVVFEVRGPVAIHAAGGQVAAVVVEVVSGLFVEAGFLEQPPDGVIFEAGFAVVLVAQAYQLAELVPVVGEGGVVGVVALVNQPCFVVGPGGSAIQGIGMAEQAAFGITFEAFGGLVRVDEQHQLTCFVLVFGNLAGGVDQFGQLPQRVVFPLRGLA